MGKKHFIIVSLLLFIITPCPAITITVEDNDSAADYGKIQDAINAAAGGDTIIVMPGTYVENINMQGKAITLRSTDPTDGAVVLATIIDGGGIGSVITCSSYEEPNTVIEGFLIRNGAATDVGDYYYGGGMYNYYSSPTVSNCTFSGNTAYGTYGFGGGMSNNNSSPTVTNCTFSSNTADLDGGGMYNVNSSPTVSNCTFSGNTTNHNDGGGGGMCNNYYSSPTVTNCTFSGNSASDLGGGGGIRNYDSSDPTVINCTFSGNSAREYGGGMWNINNSSPTVSNCTFSNNTANIGGGGMHNYYSSPTVSNCILWGNTAYLGNEIYNDSSAPVISYSDIAGCFLGGSWDTSIGTNGGGNIDANPLFVDVVRLAQGSPCIDAGDNDAVPIGIVNDLDGGDRFVDVIPISDTGNGTGPIVDMGAYEVQVNKIYVKANAAGDNNGSSWQHAFGSLQDALTVVGIYSSVWVAEGTYYPDPNGLTDPRETAFRMKNNVAIYGGFAGNEPNSFDLSNRDPAANETICACQPLVGHPGTHIHPIEK